MTPLFPRWTNDDEALLMLQKAILAILAKESLELVDYQRIRQIATQAHDIQAGLINARLDSHV